MSVVWLVVGLGLGACPPAQEEAGPPQCLELMTRKLTADRAARRLVGEAHAVLHQPLGATEPYVMSRQVARTLAAIDARRPQTSRLRVLRSALATSLEQLWSLEGEVLSCYARREDG